MNLVELKQSIDIVFNDSVLDESIFPSTIALELKKIIDYTNQDILASKSNISTTYRKNSTQWVISPGDNLETALGKISFGIEALMLLTEALKTVQERSSNSGTNTGDQNLTLYALLNSPIFSGTVTISELMLGQNSYPSTLGAPNQVLTTNGYGVLFWKTPAVSTGGTGGTTQDLSAYATLNSPAFTGMVTGITKLMINLGNVPNIDFTAAVNLNTNKISFDSMSSTRLKDTSGVNTGDQDLSGKVDKVTGFVLSKNDLTNLLKIAYDNVVTWISTNGSNLISHLLLNNNPHSVTAAQVGSPSGSGTSTGSNTGDQDLSVKVDKAPGERLINALEISKVGNQSGTNTGDQFIPTTLPASDVFAWAKASVKPSYTTAEVSEGSNLYFTAARALATILAGVSFASGTIVTATDSFLIAIGKLQAQISSHTGSTSNPHAVTKAQVGLSSVPNTDFTAAVNLNNDKISFDITSSQRLKDTRGANTGDQVIPTTLPASDVSAWAKAAVKPSYATDELSDTLNKRYVTDAEKAKINNSVLANANSVFSGVNSNTIIALISATNTIAWTGLESNMLRIVLTRDSILSNPSAPVTNALYQFMIEQNTTGLWTLGYGTMFKFPDGVKPVIDLNPNSKGILTALYDGTALLVVSIQNFL